MISYVETTALLHAEHSDTTFTIIRERNLTTGANELVFYVNRKEAGRVTAQTSHA